jgi:hypothetical protein
MLAVAPATGSGKCAITGRSFAASPQWSLMAAGQDRKLRCRGRHRRTEARDRHRARTAQAARLSFSRSRMRRYGRSQPAADTRQCNTRLDLRYPPRGRRLARQFCARHPNRFSATSSHKPAFATAKGLRLLQGAGSSGRQTPKT